LLINFQAIWASKSIYIGIAKKLLGLIKPLNQLHFKFGLVWFKIASVWFESKNLGLV